jgi:hypothetical protein
MLTEDQGNWLCIAIICLGMLPLLILAPTERDEDDDDTY